MCASSPDGDRARPTGAAYGDRAVGAKAGSGSSCASGGPASAARRCRSSRRHCLRRSSAELTRETEVPFDPCLDDLAVLPLVDADASRRRANPGGGEARDLAAVSTFAMPSRHDLVLGCDLVVDDHLQVGECRAVDAHRAFEQLRPAETTWLSCCRGVMVDRFGCYELSGEREVALVEGFFEQST
jgi:hypothetical protein